MLYRLHDDQTIQDTTRAVVFGRVEGSLLGDRGLCVSGYHECMDQYPMQLRVGIPPSIRVLLFFELGLVFVGFSWSLFS